MLIYTLIYTYCFHTFIQVDININIYRSHPFPAKVFPNLDILINKFGDIFTAISFYFTITIYAIPNTIVFIFFHLESSG